MLAVDGRLGKCDEETDQDRRHGAIDEALVLEDGWLQVHQQQHQCAAGDQPDALARHEVVGIVGADLLQRDDGRGAVDHDQTDHDDEHRCAEKPCVVCEFSAHRARTNSSKCCPRCSKLRY